MGKRTVTIAIHLSNQLIAQALCELLLKSGYTVVMEEEPSSKDFAANVLLVDIHTLGHDLVRKYSDAKILLIDTGIEQDKLCATLLSYRIHGVLSPHTEFHLFKKALKAVSEGQIWIDNGSVKAMLHNPQIFSPTSPISGREREIVECICQGLSNNEIARRLALSPNTVKAHLNRIYKKMKVTSRSKLMTQALQSHPVSS
ncbi:MAG: response regulator transcription factor [Syntrophorhabdales bacterium]|jgi:DNA-binding NarL/FixJ family response regulator